MLLRNLPKTMTSELYTLMVKKSQPSKTSRTSTLKAGGVPNDQPSSSDDTKRMKQRAVLVIISLAGLLLSGVMVFERIGSSDGSAKAPKVPIDVMVLAKNKTAEMTGAEAVCLPVIERSTALVDEGTWDADGPAAMYSVSWVTQCQAQSVTGANSAEDAGSVTCNGSTYVIEYKKNKDLLRGRISGLCSNDATQVQSEFCTDWSKDKSQTDAIQTVCQLNQTAPSSTIAPSTTAPTNSGGSSTSSLPETTQP